MGMNRQPSVTALAEAEALMQELKPTLVEMIERNDPAVKNLNFNDIEANASAVGDLLAKLMMLRAVKQQPPATASEEAAAREAAARKTRPQRGAQRKPAELQMTRIADRPRKLKTARGEIAFSREYLYFPELKTGVFPPGDATGNPGGRTHPARDTTPARARRG